LHTSWGRPNNNEGTFEVLKVAKPLAICKCPTACIAYYFLGRHAVEIIAMLLAIALVLR
jgi:hypothetical protein